MRSWALAALAGFAAAFPGFSNYRDIQARHPRLEGAFQPAVAAPRATPGVQNCTLKWFTQTIDHFSWASTPTGASTYQQRYFVNDQYWKNGTEGAIFFYAGNEADVTLYVDHTGLMWENAARFNALIVFAEHRYYGASQPFRGASGQFLSYLTHEQALADYAALVYDIQTNQLGVRQPVIVFGGSYGGMLAAWGRTKYPGTFAGAIAASAPVLAFQGLQPAWQSEAYWTVVTADASVAGGSAPACSSNVRAAWSAIFALGSTAKGRAQLSQMFQLCTPLQSEADVYALAILHLNAWDTAAMGNFPYPSNYLTGGDPNPPLPAWPVRVMCDALSDASLPGNTSALLAAFNAAGAVFNNATQNVACYALPTDLFEDGIWDWQWCTETLPEETYFTRDGVNDMFWAWNISNEQVEARCRDKYGYAPRWNWIAEAYGGRITGASNIVFSNGGYDPWHAGGVLPNSSTATPSTPAILIDQGAHHLDLFFSNPQDPPAVTAARQTEMSHVQSWIEEFWAQQAAGSVDL